MAFCIKCGTNVGDSLFCGNCGAKITYNEKKHNILDNANESEQSANAYRVKVHSKKNLERCVFIRVNVLVSYSCSQNYGHDKIVVPRVSSVQNFRNINIEVLFFLPIGRYIYLSIYLYSSYRGDVFAVANTCIRTSCGDIYYL